MSSPYHIAHIGLKQGLHTFEYTLNAAFFAQFNAEFHPNDTLQVTLQFDKTTEHLYHLTFDINGTITAECDRCLADLQLPIKESYPVMVKMVAKLPNTTDSEDELDLLYITPDMAYIDISQLTYEFALLSLPQHVAFPLDNYGKPTCPRNSDGTMPCNENVLLILNRPDEDEPNNDADIDPRWKSLRDLQ